MKNYKWNLNELYRQKCDTLPKEKLWNNEMLSSIELQYWKVTTGMVIPYVVIYSTIQKCSETQSLSMSKWWWNYKYGKLLICV